MSRWGYSGNRSARTGHVAQKTSQCHSSWGWKTQQKRAGNPPLRVCEERGGSRMDAQRFSLAAFPRDAWTEAVQLRAILAAAAECEWLSVITQLLGQEPLWSMVFSIPAVPPSNQGASLLQEVENWWLPWRAVALAPNIRQLEATCCQ